MLFFNVTAIKYQPNNVKAYYRKVQALRAQKKYRAALDTALAAHDKSPVVSPTFLNILRLLLVISNLTYHPYALI